MGRHKMEFGICRLCGEEKDLTFEHVPPRISFNKTTTYLSVPFEEYIKVDNPLKEKYKGKKMQGGIGYNSLCRECNNFLGSNYVNSYQKWVLTGKELFQKYTFTSAHYTALSQEPLKIIKQILSMFLAINGEWYLKAYPEIAEFVKNPNSNELTERYRIFSYLNNEGNIRYCKHSVFYSAQLGEPVNCSEIAFPPYGYILTIDFDKRLSLVNELTYLKSYKANETIDLKIMMNKLPTYSHIPFDYRTKEKFSSDLEKGIKM